MSWVNKSKRKDVDVMFFERKSLEIKDIRVGQIYQFTNGYHTKTPYYAEVIEVDLSERYFITSIPDYHELKIGTDNNFNYHKQRMALVGDYKDFGHLLKNQKGLVKQNKYN